MKFAPGTPVRWQDSNGLTRYGTVQKQCAIGISVLVDGGRRHLVSPEAIALDQDD